MKKIIRLCATAFTLLLPFSVSAEQSVFLEIGAQSGGDKVAQNISGGDDYSAGSGAVIGAGVKKSLNAKVDFKATAAARYQGGNDSAYASGLVAEGAALYKFNNQWSMGGGLHGDFASKVKDSQGTVTKFDDAFAPMMLVDWSYTQGISIGGKYIAADYKTTTGKDYNGNQVAIYVHFNAF